jgi:V8-like Glu-specific endopeptidase
MPKVDNDKLLKEDEKTKNDNSPLRISYIHDVNLNTINSGQWLNVDDGKVWVLKVKSSKAFSLGLAFKELKLPENSYFYIYNEDKTVIQGPFSQNKEFDIDGFASDFVEGDAIILEYFQPKTISEKPIISISKVIHVYRDLYNEKIFSQFGYGDSEDCHIDVSCNSGDAWYNQSSSVAMLIVDYSILCSGAMINNTREDGTPYFLTANHCINESYNGHFYFRFHYKSPTCNGGSDSNFITFNGATALDYSSISDYALLLLHTTPDPSTEINYSGWNRSSTASSNVTCLHHPKGDVMKISKSYSTAISSGDYWLVNNWDIGTTEGGSSGSPLYDRNKRIIGQDYAGTGHEPCDSRKGTYFGKLSKSWDLGLSNYLDPENTGVMTLNSLYDFSITGPSQICQSNQATYSINNLPQGVTISWSHSPNLTYVSGQGTNNYKVAYKSDGTGWVKAVFTNNSGVVIEKDVIVGTQIPLISEVYDLNCHCTVLEAKVGGNHYFIALGENLSNTSSHYRWTLNPPAGSDPRERSFPIIGYGKQFNFSPMVEGNHTISLEYYESCSGWVNALSKSFWVNSGGGFPMSVYPNPASNTLTISTNDSYNLSPDENINLELYDSKQKKVKSDKFNGKDITWDVRSFSEGIYYLYVVK